MLTKKVNRYWCEFCRKSGGSAGHMRKHEARCTKNPNRVCGVCKILTQEQPDLETLKAIVNSYGLKPDEFGGFLEAPESLFIELSKAAGECPACILAAIRQCSIPVPVVRGFNFQTMMDAIWSDVNEENTY